MRLPLALLALLLPAGVAYAQRPGTFVDYSTTLSTTPLDVMPAAAGARVRILLLNTDFVTASGGNGIAVWCRWATAAAGPAAPHGVSSFPLLPGGGNAFTIEGVPQQALNCVAESGNPIIYAEKY